MYRIVNIILIIQILKFNSSNELDNQLKKANIDKQRFLNEARKQRKLEIGEKSNIEREIKLRLI